MIPRPLEKTCWWSGQIIIFEIISENIWNTKWLKDKNTVKKEELGNYKSVNLASIFGKILEQIMKEFTWRNIWTSYICSSTNLQYL